VGQLVGLGVCWFWIWAFAVANAEQPRIKIVSPIDLSQPIVSPTNGACGWVRMFDAASCWRSKPKEMIGTPIIRRNAMLRYVLIAFASLILVCASLVPDDAFARGGFRGGGGFHGGGARAAGFRGGAVHAGRYGGAARYGAVGRYGGAGRYAVAGRGYGYRGAAYRGGVYRGAAYGAAAVGAAAVGAAAAGAYYGGYGGYYNNGCYRDAYGQWICPNQY
jgi:hypothetical protein